MKNGLLIWNVLLTAVVGYLLFLQFRPSKTAGSQEGKTNGAAVSPQNSSFRIAYFEMDSVEDRFDMVKDVKSEMNKKEDAITNEVSRMAKNIEQRLSYFQSREKMGQLTPAETEAAGRELRNLDDQLKSRKQTLDQEYNEFVLRKGKEVKSTIEDFLKEFNKDKGFAYIMTNEPGFIYYRDTAYNITADVIRGLNEKHKGKNKKD